MRNDLPLTKIVRFTGGSSEPFNCPGLTTLPKGLDFNHIVGVGLMGGIGFTMSIFITELGFAHHAEDLLMAENKGVRAL